MAKTRPKGYASWDPSFEVLVVLDQVRGILEEYRYYLPMTARQIFYRMVGAHGFEKTEKAYKRLSGYLVRARRAQIIPFSAIRDDGTTALSQGGYDSPEEFLNMLRDSADGYLRDRMQEQAMRVEVWCEAAGMAPQLERVCRDYGITVYSTGGFSSVTVTRQIAERALREDRPTYLLHIGDYDPSGESLYEVMMLDARTFVWQLRTGRDNPMCDINPVRVALTPAQIREHDIPTAPPKKTDSRSENWLYESEIGATAQAEAMPPDLLAETLRDAVLDVIDEQLWQDVVEEENDERERIRTKLESLEWDG